MASERSPTPSLPQRLRSRTAWRRRAGTAALASLSDTLISVRRHRPVDRDVGIVPAQAALRRLVVEAVDLVGDDRVRLQRAEGVGEADRDEAAARRRPAVSVAPHHRPIGRAAAAQVDGDVVHRPGEHPHELGLRGRAASWKCRPRIVPRCVDSDWLSCRSRGSRDPGTVERATACRSRRNSRGCRRSAAASPGARRGSTGARHGPLPPGHGAIGALI